jgi:phosphoglycerol transferase MdoB-like AlkP superfamily enzyme
MAYKSFFSASFLPFHEQAAGVSWDKVDKNLQAVILALMKISGLGFLIVALVLLGFPLVHVLYPDSPFQIIMPGISFVYCLGLFYINYQLSGKTKAKTPWKGALAAAIVVGIGMIVSIFH